MIFLLLILVALITWHFIAQSMIIPNYAYKKKYLLYAKRDHLRRLFIEESISEQEFYYLDTFLSNTIMFVKQVSIFDLLLFNKKNNHKKHSIIMKQMSVIDECKNPEYIELKVFSYESAFKLSVVNSIGWLPYLIIPSLIVYLISVLNINKLYIKIKDSLTFTSKEVGFTGGLNVAN